MELSKYSVDKLESLNIAVSIMIISATSERHIGLAIDLTYWGGEIRLAIADSKMEDEKLSFNSKLLNKK